MICKLGLPCHKYDNNYQTSGYFIVELCPNTCLNGGQCFAENQCMCSSSYTGNRCENLGKKLNKIIKTKWSTIVFHNTIV